MCAAQTNPTSTGSYNYQWADQVVEINASNLNYLTTENGGGVSIKLQDNQLNLFNELPTQKKMYRIKLNKKL